MKKHRVAWIAFAAVLALIIGCAQPQSAPGPSGQSGAAAELVMLSPIQQVHGTPFELMVPEGATVVKSEAGDLTTIQFDKVLVTERNGRITGVVPVTLAEMQAAVTPKEPGAVVSEISVPNVRLAYLVERKLPAADGEKQILRIEAFGTTEHNQLSFQVPAADFPRLEKLVRAMIASYRPAKVDRNPAPQPEESSIDMVLRPIRELYGTSFELWVPEEAAVFPSGRGDMTTIQLDPLFIIEITRVNRSPVPETVAAMQALAEEEHPGSKVREAHVPGARWAYEIKSVDDTSGRGELTSLDLHAYGTNWNKLISFSVPTAEFPRWEGLIRKMMSTFNPGNLDGGVLPGHP